jgi:hypothetical protein
MLVEGSMPALQAMSVRSSSVQLLYVEPDLDNVQPVMMVWQSDSDLPRPTSVLFRAHGPGVSVNRGLVDRELSVIATATQWPGGWRWRL